MSVIQRVDVVDIRVPTSDTLLGSDPFHKKPNYSTVLTTLETDDGLVGTSVNFTAGARTPAAGRATKSRCPRRSVSVRRAANGGDPGGPAARASS